MIKILLGGSPCTYWSIAQKNNRETEPSGMGWELFKNYLIAKEKFKPDFFLYENNKSAAQAIKDEIKKQFGVWDGTFLMEDTGVRYIEINSALVSAQNRQRFYVHNCGEVGQPEDRGILLRDILESGTGGTDNNKIIEPVPVNDIDGKSCTIRATCYKDGIRNLVGNDIDKRTCVAEPICLNSKSGRMIDGKFISDKQPSLQDRIYSTEGKATAVTTSFLPKIAEPVRVGDMGSKAQAHRIYSIDGKSVCINSGGGGMGAKTGLYAIPKYLNDKNMEHLMRPFGAKGKIVSEDTDKSPTVLAAAGAGGGNAIYYAERTYGKHIPVYEVRNGLITIKGKQYPIKLADGFYIIRKLTVTECCRLQGMPDWWFLDNEGNKILSDSQAYKGLGNGWQLDTVKYILEHGLKNVPQNEELIVLSLYDGIGTGRRILEELGFTKVKYYAYEIDKYCIKLTSYRYPDIIHCGDAFQVRDKNWRI